MTGLAKKNKSMMGMDKAAEIVGILFMSRDYAHRAHLYTSSYAKHIALNEFYDGIVDLTDALAEAAQGCYGKIEFDVVDLVGNVKDPISAIKSHMEMVQDAAEGCDNRALNNVLDDICTLYAQTLYKLAELS